MTLPLRLYVAGLAENRISTSMSNWIGIAANLHVALFEDVEQADLHQFVQLGQFVHGEDAAVHARDQAEVQRLLGRHAGAAGQLGRVDLADDVGELGARGQPLGVALFARPPGDGHFVLRHARRRTACQTLRDRLVGIVVQRGSGNVEVGNLSSRKRTSSRISRLLACPFSPRKSMSCSAIRARLISGMTVLS